MTQILRFRSWQQHNRRALKDVAEKRAARGVRLDAPLSLAKVVVVTHLDEQFASFAQLVGGPVAETYFLRALQWAADRGGAVGAVSCERFRFGPVVLSRPWHIVSRRTGEKVYDALLASNICVLSTDTSVDLPRYKSTDKSTDPSKDVSPPPSPSPSPEVSPPTPLAGGSESAAPSNGAANGNGHATPLPAAAGPEPLSRTELAILEAVLAKLVAGHAPLRTSDILEFRNVRRRSIDGTIQPDEARKVIAEWRHYPAFATAVREAQLGPRREARQARADSSANSDPPKSPQDDQDPGPEAP